MASGGSINFAMTRWMPPLPSWSFSGRNPMGIAIGKTLLRRLVRDINHAGTGDGAGAGDIF